MYTDESLMMNSCILPVEEYFAERMSAQLTVRELHEARKRSKRFFDEDPCVADDRMASWVNDNLSSFWFA